MHASCSQEFTWPFFLQILFHVTNNGLSKRGLKTMKSKFKITKQRVVLLALYLIYTFKLFSLITAVHLICTTKENLCTVFERQQNSRKKNLHLVYCLFKGSNDIHVLDTKHLTWLMFQVIHFAWSTCCYKQFRTRLL